MKTNQTSQEQFESTYALLVRSQEKERNVFEGLAYLLVIASAIFSISQFAQQPVSVPTSLTPVTQTAQHATAQQQGA